MKNFKFLVFSSLSLMLIWMLSCDKQTTARKECSNDSYGLSNDEVVRIGELHNEYVLQAIAEFDFSVPVNKYEQEFRETYGDLIPDASLSDTLRLEVDWDIVDYKETFCDFSQVESAYNSIFSLIENAKEDELDKFLSDLADIERNSTRSLTLFDASFVKTVISVAKNSALLWFPEGGGQNYLEVVHDRLSAYHPHDHPKRYSWREVLAADAAAAAGTFTGIGFGILAVPGTNAAFAGVIAWSAGSASTWAALRHCEP